MATSCGSMLVDKLLELSRYLTRNITGTGVGAGHKEHMLSVPLAYGTHTVSIKLMQLS